MQQKEWLFAFASVIGNGHLSENIPCQDACKVESNKDYTIAVVFQFFILKNLSHKKSGT